MNKELEIVVISDTHGQEQYLDLPPGDVIIFCGDCETNISRVKKFIEWFSKLDYRYKIMIAGNHDSLFEKMGYDTTFKMCDEKGIIYLQDTEIIIEDLKIYGSPWTPEFCGWHFMLPENSLKSKWDSIPEDTDILITHGPAYGIGDLVKNSYGTDPHVGSTTLTEKIQKMPHLKYHLIGHIHEGRGIYQTSGFTTINASVLDHNYKNIKIQPTFKIKKE